MLMAARPVHQRDGARPSTTPGNTAENTSQEPNPEVAGSKSRLAGSVSARKHGSKGAVGCGGSAGASSFRWNVAKGGRAGGKHPVGLGEGRATGSPAGAGARALAGRGGALGADEGLGKTGLASGGRGGGGGGWGSSGGGMSTLESSGSLLRVVCACLRVCGFARVPRHFVCAAFASVCARTRSPLCVYQKNVYGSQ